MNPSKYIRTGEDDIIVFSASISHDTFAHLNPKSAGFIKFGVGKDGMVFIKCYGESYSLQKGSLEDGTLLASMQIIGGF